MRQRLRQTIFAAFLVVAALWVVWIFYYFGEMAYQVFAIPVLPNVTADFLAKNLLIFALLGSVDRLVDLIFSMRNRTLQLLLGIGGLVLAYFLICFYLYILLQTLAALYEFVRGLAG